MITIHKYRLEIVDEKYYDMPKGVEFLSVQVQNDELCMWVLVNTAAPLKPVDVIIHGTGHNADDVSFMKFVGTFQLDGGSFVGHVWARQP